MREDDCVGDCVFALVKCTFLLIAPAVFGELNTRDSAASAFVCNSIDFFHKGVEWCSVGGVIGDACSDPVERTYKLLEMCAGGGGRHIA